MSLFKFKTKPGLTLWPDLACARDIIYIMIYTTYKAESSKIQIVPTFYSSSCFEHSSVELTKKATKSQPGGDTNSTER